MKGGHRLPDVVPMQYNVMGLWDSNIQILVEILASITASESTFSLPQFPLLVKWRES